MYIHFPNNCGGRVIEIIIDVPGRNYRCVKCKERLKELSGEHVYPISYFMGVSFEVVEGLARVNS